jgi:GNAT superfamily N-acetyltransferase
VNAVRSIGLATELALAATRGSVEDRGDYLVVRTPDDPGYYYGNLLVLPAAPQVGEVAFWTRRFGEAFGGQARVRHVTFLWDGTAGDVGADDELRAAGFRIETTETMVASALVTPAAALPVRVLAPDEVMATADLAWRSGDRHDERFREFLNARASWQAALIARGAARFVGAYDGDALVASCGLVTLGERARFQDVLTAEPYRGRGLAAALLAAAAAGTPARELVIVAHAGSTAARVYARAGFRVAEHTASACRYPADATA